MNFLTARQRFYQEIQQPNAQIDLAAAALYIAQEEYPALDVEAYLSALDALAAEASDRLPAESYPLKIIQAISQYLFADLGFRGNQQDYYSPQNSFLNDVIDRRTGIPITLALVYLEIAKRLNFPMVGVGMPGHFLIRPAIAEMSVFVDAFHQGEILFPEDCEARLQQIYGQPVALQDEFLQPVSARAFLARMLTNLKMIYVSCQQLEKALSATERILLLFPDAIYQRRDRGLLYYETGQFTAACRDLAAYVESAAAAEDRPQIMRLLNRLDPDWKNR
ncbi:MAG: tetratricopeptide repeat protein [Leptolyngbyaceae cyanobacterium SM1_1_3]|nr:tetratricopeptide repeat protein [Leptolyngbyaceae cyanobacterium SM1_1_3]NJN02464.1 tetratricopeptide repeat protein [Leptolyngbyaceae cyanobacterium RM1_1_2]NJO10189.1 tetratricopeptide repeat protein [Leptolyngbyaceae cyanobacterium SL_1_1]